MIKDEPFDIGSLKSNYRYKIKKGCKNFDVRTIEPCNYKEELYNVQVAAFSAYPAKYRPTLEKKKCMEDIDTWDKYDAFGAFYRENNELVGYALIRKSTPDFYELSVEKTNPQYEKLQLNAALVKGLMDYYAEFLSKGGIICDGARNINHETHFQDYLEKYFHFRKAYSNLNVRYNKGVAAVVKSLYPFRKLLGKLDAHSMVHKINGVLKMEEIIRERASRD